METAMETPCRRLSNDGSILNTSGFFILPLMGCQFCQHVAETDFCPSARRMQQDRGREKIRGDDADKHSNSGVLQKSD